MYISLKDNRYYNTVPWNEAWKDYGESGIIAPAPTDDGYKDTLKKFSGVPLTELTKPENEKKYGKFLVFPSDAAKSDLDDDKKVLFELLDADTDNPKFRTGNVMGFFSLRGKEQDGKTSNIRIQITSRFDDTDGKDNFFLHYMLQKICNMAIAPSVGSGTESFYDFLPYLFPGYLKEACKQGIFRAYVTREYNDANVRGPIDVTRHIRYNIPFNGKVAYHTREYTADNKITQLVRHTIEYIRSMGFSILDGDAREDVGKIIASTPTYTKNDRSKVIAQNIHPVTHPYYTAYEPLRTLCLGILLHKKLSYGNDNKNKIAGILFDGASLWEEYLNDLLKRSCEGRLIHPNNRTHENKQYLFDKEESDSSRTIYPDFLWGLSEDSKTAKAVLDAKYKPLDDKGLCRDDANQMLAYMLRFDSKSSYLIYPQKYDDKKDIYSKKYALYRDTNIFIQTIGLCIPQAAKENNSQDAEEKDYERFCSEMKNAESAFINRLQDYLNKGYEILKDN